MSYVKATTDSKNMSSGIIQSANRSNRAPTNSQTEAIRQGSAVPAWASDRPHTSHSTVNTTIHRLKDGAGGDDLDQCLTSIATAVSEFRHDGTTAARRRTGPEVKAVKCAYGLVVASLLMKGDLGEETQWHEDPIGRKDVDRSLAYISQTGNRERLSEIFETTLETYRDQLTEEDTTSAWLLVAPPDVVLEWARTELWPTLKLDDGKKRRNKGARRPELYRLIKAVSAAVKSADPSTATLTSTASEAAVI